LVKKAKKEKKYPTVTKGNTPVKKAKIKKKLPKAGSEAEILTLATASLASVVGACISLKKRK
jgi:albumin-binding protein family protein-3